MDKLEALKLLGLKENSDIREVKKAYAKKLRETHPEDDPVGFQRIKEAYEIVKQPRLQSSQEPLEPMIIQKKEYIKQDTYDYTHLKVDKKEVYDFDSILIKVEKETQRIQNLEEKAIKQLSGYMSKKTSFKMYHDYFNLEEYESIWTKESYLKEVFKLCQINASNLSFRVKRLFIKKLELNNSTGIIQSQLYELLKINNTYLIGITVVPLVFSMLMNEVMLVNKQNATILFFALALFVFMYALYSLLIRKMNEIKAYILTMLIGVIVYFIFAVILSFVSEELLEFYVTVVVPFFMIGLSIALGCIIYMGIDKIKNRKK